MTVTFGSQYSFIPSIESIITWSTYLYQRYGIPALFVSALLESIAYIGLYFPSIIILTVLISNGTIYEYAIIASVTALAIVCGSTVSYYCGYYGLINEQNVESDSRDNKSTWFWFILCNWHPNAIGLWFFKRGLHKQPLFPWILWVWPIMFCWGFFLCFVVYSLREQTEEERMTGILIGLFFWLCIDVFLRYKKNLVSTNQSG